MTTAFDLKQRFGLQTRSLVLRLPALLCLSSSVFSVHPVNWSQGMQKGFRVVATCLLQGDWFTETAGVSITGKQDSSRGWQGV